MEKRINTVDLIQSMAHMTCLTDRDDISVSMCITLYEMLECSKISFYRILHEDRKPLMHLALQFNENGISRFEVDNHASKSLNLSQDPLLNKSLTSDSPLLVATECTRALLIARRDKNIYSVFDLSLAKNLQPSDYRLLQGLTKIYENHLKVLDYSETDTLTNLRNRKTLEAEFTKITGALQKLDKGLYEQEVTYRHYYLVVIDIDNFKSINDNYGHLFGDEILLIMAQLMQKTFRCTDHLFRYGGEEFVIILDATCREELETILERFRSLIEQHHFPQIGQVTISIGVTQIMPFEVLSMAMGRADNALYQAKANGRNQVIFIENIILEQHDNDDILF